MNYILIIGTFEAFFLILLLLSKRNKSLPDLFLGIMLSLLALSIFMTYLELHNAQNNYPFPQIINTNWMVMFLHGPALWFYIKSQSSPDFRFKPIYVLHFVPFLAFTTFHYFNYISLPALEKIQIAKDETFKEHFFYKITVLSIGLSTITYNIWALRLIHKRYRKLLLNFSKIEDIDLNWLRILTIASLFVFALNHVLFNLNLIFEYSSHKILSLVSYSFASVYVLFLGFFGLKQKNVFVTVPYVAELKKAEKQIPQKESAFIDDFLMFMKNNKPFLDPELNISKLSKLLSVKTEYLSEILNSHLQQTFFDFINKYRIEEFKKQYADEKNKNFSIIGIAFNCGFNSKASFYRAFKKFEKTTPSGYLRKVS